MTRLQSHRLAGRPPGPVQNMVWAGPTDGARSGSPLRILPDAKGAVLLGTVLAGQIQRSLASDVDISWVQANGQQTALVFLVVVVIIAGLFIVFNWHEVFDLCISMRWRFRRARLCCIRLSGKRTEIPEYWENSERDLSRAQKRDDPDFFDDKYPVDAETCEQFARLMNTTSFWEGGTAFGHKGFRVVRALRIEDSVMWTNYQRKAAEIQWMNRRGCSWIGDAPKTVDKLEEIEHHDFFALNLDEQINEAYMWHATNPVAALHIVETGFRISREHTAGARFGHGAYFAEDCAKADDYAKAGTGIFKDCYAMFLCRVALGRQHVTHKMRDPTATEEAMAHGCDSILAEPPYQNAAREYIIWDQDQVYPEYAIIYERHAEADDEESSPMSIEDASHLSLDQRALPWYWHNSAEIVGRDTSGAMIFHETHPSVHMKATMQRIIDKTWVHSWTSARKGADGRMLPAEDPHGDMPDKLRVLKVLRLEYSEMWNAYREEQDAIRHRRGRLQPGIAASLRTLHALPFRLRSQLMPDVAEGYLWCPCSPTEVASITERGFLERTAASWSERFGQGFCLSECSSRADENSADEPDGYYRGYYAMLLCRASLGKVQFLSSPDPSAHEHTGEGHEFDGTVATSEGYRDFMFHSKDAIYPEYAVIYERIHHDKRVRGLSTQRWPEKASAKPLRPLLCRNQDEEGWSSEDEWDDSDGPV